MRSALLLPQRLGAKALAGGATSPRADMVISVEKRVFMALLLDVVGLRFRPPAMQDSARWL